jgi:hypothetical protein
MRQREAFLPPKPNLVRGASTSTEDEDAMDLCDLSVSLDYGDRANVTSVMEPSSSTMMSREDEPAEISEASSEDTEESLLDSRSSTPSPLPTDFHASLQGYTTEANQKQSDEPILVSHSRDDSIDRDSGDNNKPSSTEQVPLLPLPSRDVESVDPEIARAERRLWGKIDLALHEYSQEIMMIMQSKGTGDGNKQTNPDIVHQAVI